MIFTIFCSYDYYSLLFLRMIVTIFCSYDYYSLLFLRMIVTIFCSYGYYSLLFLRMIVTIFCSYGYYLLLFLGMIVTLPLFTARIGSGWACGRPSVTSASPGSSAVEPFTRWQAWKLHQCLEGRCEEPSILLGEIVINVGLPQCHQQQKMWEWGGKATHFQMVMTWDASKILGTTWLWWALGKWWDAKRFSKFGIQEPHLSVLFVEGPWTASEKISVSVGIVHRKVQPSVAKITWMGTVTGW